LFAFGAAGCPGFHRIIGSTMSPVQPLSRTALERNTSALLVTKGGAERARLLADRVGLLARHGYLTEAAACTSRTRRVVECAGDSEARARLSMSNAILAHCRGNIAAATALADIAVSDSRLNGHRGLVAECEAWSAQLHAASGVTLDRAIAHIDEAVMQAGVHAPSAMARAFYILAALCQQSDLASDSARGYRWARAYASDAGDLHLVQTIICHRKHVRSNHAHWRLARGRFDDAMRAAAMKRDGEPARESNEASDKSTAAWERRHCRRARSVGDPPHSTECHLPFPEATGASGSAATAHSDRALAIARRGNHEKSLEEANAAASLLDLRADVYTASVVVGNLAEVAARLGCSRAATSLDERSHRLWQQHQALWHCTRQLLLASGVLRHLSARVDNR